MLLSMGLLMIVFSPDSDRDSRGAALSEIASGINSGKDETRVVLGGVTYSLKKMDRLGLWFTVNAN